ncbi:hypothetical protein NIES4071_40420 [Calothrix sp. NIES-4071]|nr:hypothetical protein NIES4071_40420 [Calothrix sp. NIES-4071]BAZ58359.1 hypothetical protein NIES4105_40360 [Calothrix sp. NIES-4105]
MKSIFSRNGIYCAVGLTSILLLASTSAQAQMAPNSAQKLSQALKRAHNESVIPVPGTTATTSAALMQSEPGATQIQSQEQTQEVTTKQVAQADIDPGRRTRGGSSYVGVAGNIGLGGGDSALGDGNFAVMSKVGLTRTFSVRPAAIFGDNTAILIPVTYDFSLQQADDPFVEPLPIAPYVGVGAAIKTSDDAQVAFLVTGGVDFPLTQQFTATAAINAGFFDQTDVGLLVGVGYNFGGF